MLNARTCVCQPKVAYLEIFKRNLGDRSYNVIIPDSDVNEILPFDSDCIEVKIG